MGDYNHTRHAIAYQDGLIGDSRHRGTVVSHDNAMALSGPRKPDGIGGSRDSNILDANQFQLGNTNQQPAHNVTVEVFIRH
jgi:hypothetical protein